MAKIRIFILILAVFGSSTLSANDGAAPPVEGAPVAGAPTEALAVTLLVGRSVVVDVATPIARVSLTSADVADALVTSPSQLLVHGKLPGSISMFVWNREGVIQRYEITVQRDLERLRTDVKHLFPGEPIEVQGNGRFVVLSGKVSTKDVMEKAVNLAAGFVDKREEVVTLLQVDPNTRTDQVLLKVRFAEVSRSALTDYGLSMFTSPTGVNNTLGRATTQQFPAPDFTDLKWSKADSKFGSPVTSSEGKFSFSDFLNFFILSEKYDLGLAIKALQSRGLFQSLAEPNLVAQSGKEASFLAGGEFPVPIAQGSGQNMAITVQFKEFGIRLNFTPVVNGDRVQLKVRPEVSTLDFANAVVLNGFRIPALSTRRTETELELMDGQTFAIAGLMNNSMNSTMQKIPGIGDIPILGQLFRSKAAQKNQTELVVMITPQILRSNSPGVTNQLPRLPEPFLPALPVNKTVEPPSPAFLLK
jgi:pilus assembly protein CpaC